MSIVVTITPSGAPVSANTEWDSNFLTFCDSLQKTGIPLSYDQKNAVWTYMQSIVATAGKQVYPISWVATAGQQQYIPTGNPNPLVGAELLLLIQETTIIAGTLDSGAGKISWGAGTGDQQNFFALYKK